MSAEWPRPYTQSELTTIAELIGERSLPQFAKRMLQKAVVEYQWAGWNEQPAKSSLEPRFPVSTNKGKRALFRQIIQLIDGGAPHNEIEEAVNSLDAIASQLLGPIDITDHEKLKSAAEGALGKIPSAGPDPRRARRQFICSLARIYKSVKREHPTRRFHLEEYGPFFEFVKAALTPFNTTKGCEADIKAVLAESKATLGIKKARESH